MLNTITDEKLNIGNDLFNDKIFPMAVQQPSNAAKDDEVAEMKKQAADIESRISAGEKVSQEEITELRERLERKHQELSKNMAKAQPKLGEIELSCLADNLNSHAISAYMNSSMKPQNAVEQMLVNQMATLHNFSMKWLSQIYNEDSELTIDHITKISNTSARLMETFQKGALALNKLRTGGKQMVIVKHQQVQVNEGGQAIVTNELTNKGGADKK